MGLPVDSPLPSTWTKNPLKKFSAAFTDLKEKLDEVDLETNTADQPATQLGAVIQSWNIFNHFYPYFEEAGGDWDSTLHATLLDALDDRNIYDCLFTLRRMLASLHDGHAGVRHSAWSTLRSLPIAFDYVENQVVVLESNNEDLKRGDIVLEI